MPSEAELIRLPWQTLARLLAARRLSPVELIESVLAHLERVNPILNAFLAVDAEQVRAQARQAEQEIRRGRWRGPLHGLPVSVKDNILTRALPTTAGSAFLAQWRPRQDAPLVRRLRRAGAIVLGKTNLHEFAYGVTSENPHYGPVRNPWDPTRMAGGSSGGSAAAVAAGLGWGSVGTDTGGSVRIPASFCGVVGLKPTFGAISTAGVVPLAESLDHVGVLARSVSIAAVLFAALRRDAHPGASPADRARRWEELGGARKRLQRLRVGWLRRASCTATEEEVAAGVERAARSLAALGVEVRETEFAENEEWVEAANAIALVEARYWHERQGYFPQQAERYGEDVRKRLEAGGQVAARNYLRGRDLLRQVRRGWNDWVNRLAVDALLLPATPLAAPQLGVCEVVLGGQRQSVRAALLRFCRAANFTGAPALTLPVGLNRQGLPVGVQLVGRQHGEAELLTLGLALERVVGELGYPHGLPR